jgi:hypothetical protein
LPSTFADDARGSDDDGDDVPECGEGDEEVEGAGRVLGAKDGGEEEGGGELLGGFEGGLGDGGEVSDVAEEVEGCGDEEGGGCCSLECVDGVL